MLWVICFLKRMLRATLPLIPMTTRVIYIRLLMPGQQEFYWEYRGGRAALISQTDTQGNTVNLQSHTEAGKLVKTTDA